MNISGLKNFFKKLSFFKNYSAFLVPVIIFVVGVLVFIPTRLMSGKLRERIVTESVSKGRQVESLSKSTVARNQWQIEQEYQKAYEADANQTALLAKQSTQRELLSYKVFPEPKDTSTLIFQEFGKSYRGAVEELITLMNARDCPSESELQRNLQSSPAFSLRGGRGLAGRLSEVDTAITDVICREKAESASVYATPRDLPGYEFWEEYQYIGRATAIDDCWYWQLAYWIVEDVVYTIRDLNSGSNSVFTSPVKRLLGVSFVGGIAGSTTVKTSASTGGRPEYVLVLGQGLAEPCTGRFTDDDIDIVHFNVAVVISAKAILPFMQQLCSAKEHKFRGFLGDEQERIFKRNQITVLESDVIAINRESPNHLLYRYGEDAVVELELVCEYIFNKNGYDEIKPESIKKATKPAAE
ncbi:MAG: hypothetical protein JSW23_11765 [Planctomycetota bacterium]|nr:MAG: hypothetical protein JSW23_11765 [Planctomycetota bacterium]